MKQWLRPLAVFAALGVAAFLLVIALQSKGDEEPPVRRAGLVRVFPESNTIALRQDAIGVELAFGYEGRIRIDRIEIPDDQLDRIAGINRLSFTPGAGKEIETLDEGRHCAVVTFWSAAAGPESPERPYSWCFTAA